MSTIGEQLGPVEGFAHRVEDRMRDLMYGRHHDAPQPAAAIPPVPPTPAMEESVSLQAIADIEDHIKAAIEDHIKPAVAKFEEVDRDALAMVDRIQANPATAEMFQLLHVLTGLPAADFPAGLSLFRMLVTAAGGQLPQQQA